MKNTMINRSSLIVVAVALLAVVSLSQLLFKGWRLDLTQNNLYTLSEGTRNLLAGIEEPVQLYFFYNRDAAQGVPQLQTYATRVKELLEELSLEAGDKLKLSLIAPEAFSPEEDRAVELGIQSVPINDAGDQLYFGLAGTNALDDVETIPFFQPNREATLEYDIAKLIYALATPEKPQLGLMSSLPMQGDFNPQTGQPGQPWAVLQQLQEFFEVTTLSPQATDIADGIALLLIVHPVQLPTETLYAIDQFVLGGGRALVFADPYAVSAAQASIGPQAQGPGPNSDLPQLFASWGVKLRADVLGDGGAALQVQSPGSNRPSYHLGMIGLPADRFSAEDVITQDLESMNLGYAGILDPVADAGTSFSPLLRSTNQAAPIPSYRVQPNTNPASLLAGFSPTGEEYAIAARLRGPARSAFPDGPPEGVDNAEHLSESSSDINVVVVADTDLLTDRFWVRVQNFLGQQIASPFAGNGDFLINAVDNLLGSSDIISIKSRAGYSRPFTRVEAMKRDADARFRQSEEALQARLRETEQKLADLQSQRSEGNVLTLSPEQRIELEQFRAQQLATRKELRDVRHSLNKEIEGLQTILKFVNIGLVPLLIVLFAIGISLRGRHSKGARA